MIIFLRVIASAIFVLTITFLALHFLKGPALKNAWAAIKNGFQKGLSWEGLSASQSRYPVELYVWETMNDEDVCEDCLERASWSPMDIADWMKEGLPQTPEADCECAPKCRCRLARYHAGLFHKKYFRKH